MVILSAEKCYGILIMLHALILFSIEAAYDKNDKANYLSPKKYSKTL